jgi:hypothetical protein
MENTSLRRLSNDSGVLLLGIFSIFFCCFMGVPGVVSGLSALILGNRARREFRENPEIFDPESLSQVNTGRICGIIGMVLSAIVVIYFAVSFIMVFTNPELMERIKEMQDY